MRMEVIESAVPLEHLRQIAEGGFNIRPTQGNRSRGLEDPATRADILRIVGDLVRE
jgi:hypothetical protein